MSVQSELLASHIVRQASKRSVPLISFVEVTFKRNGQCHAMLFHTSSIIQHVIGYGSVRRVLASLLRQGDLCKVSIYKELFRHKNSLSLCLFYCSRCSVVGSLGVIHMGIGVVSLMEKLGVESRVIIFKAGSVIVNMTNMVR